MNTLAPCVGRKTTLVSFVGTFTGVFWGSYTNDDVEEFYVLDCGGTPTYVAARSVVISVVPN